jgi:hypothetical protein
MIQIIQTPNIEANKMLFDQKEEEGEDEEDEEMDEDESD